MKQPPSDFMVAAFELEDIFAGIEQLSGSLERLEPTSEPELERAKKLLVRFTEKSQNLQGGLETLVRVLKERQASVEQAVAVVNAKAPLIAEKFREAEEKVERFQALADRVNALTELAARLGPETLREQLEALAAEAGGLYEEARQDKLRTLEKNAQALRASLRELLRKLA